MKRMRSMCIISNRLAAPLVSAMCTHTAHAAPNKTQKFRFIEFDAAAAEIVFIRHKSLCGDGRNALHCFLLFLFDKIASTSATHTHELNVSRFIYSRTNTVELMGHKTIHAAQNY